MKTKSIFLITVITFGAHTKAMQQHKGKKFQLEIQTQNLFDNWNFKFLPLDSVRIDRQDTLLTNEETELLKDSRAIICFGGGSDAEFPGGMTAFMSYFNNHFTIPESDSSSLSVGCHKVVVSFSINEIGEINDLRVVESTENELNNAVLQVFKQMPAWIPGTYKGENISTNYLLPVQIYLN